MSVRITRNAQTIEDRAFLPPQFGYALERIIRGERHPATILAPRMGSQLNGSGQFNRKLNDAAINQSRYASRVGVLQFRAQGRFGKTLITDRADKPIDRSRPD